MAVATAVNEQGPPPLVEQADLFRLEATRLLPAERRSDLGQFPTPGGIARFMATLLGDLDGQVRVLEAGAGVGTLLAAVVAEALARSARPKSIDTMAFEIDPLLVGYLKKTLHDCDRACRTAGVRATSEVVEGDFIRAAVDLLDGGLFNQKTGPGFTHAILNPPYKKLNSDSEARLLLRRVGVETSNLYAAFVALAVLLLEDGGELVAITPRSFCNGPYFRPFRRFLLERTNLTRVHLFESRKAAFAEDDVLQENIIWHVVKGRPQGPVLLSTSGGPDDEVLSVREVPFEQLVRPDDPEAFWHLVQDRGGQHVADELGKLPARLADLGVAVSTGKVVDFRAKEFLRTDPGPKTKPLIYPTHFADGRIGWPKVGKKPNALVDAPETEALWMPSGTYVLVKRFSAKEEPRRVVAALFDPALVPAEKIGFENHLNVYHAKGTGLAPDLARGLVAFLNSTMVDTHFRQFNGHTQVNATDLRNLRYPARRELEKLGKLLGDRALDQDQLDEVVEGVLGVAVANDEVTGQAKIDEALVVLEALGMPLQQRNLRSALTLLALLDLKPSTPWSGAGSPMIGITPIMDFMRDHYGKTYAPNTRETVRRQTIHQFLDAGLVVANPDDPTRAVNSAKNVYQVPPDALGLLRSFGSPDWTAKLAAYITKKGTLASTYAQARDMARLPVQLPSGATLHLSPGGQNELVQKIVEDFCPLFAPGNLIYVGDTGDKFALFDKAGLAALGVTMDSHGKMPDVVVHRTDKDWLVLIEAVTSHGPVNPKRRAELSKLFAKSTAGLVFVTAFLTRKAMLKYLGDISWETEVWVAESPEHMIHFNGERFLGPYGK